MKNYWKEATILLIVLVLVSSSIAIADNKNSEMQKSSVTDPISSIDVINQYVRTSRDDIIWDNGMDYDALVSAQEPITTYLIDVYPADDFKFDNYTLVTGVRWIGGFFLGDPESWDWCIDIYWDDGTGFFPGEEEVGQFCYSWEEINKVEIETNIWEMWIELPYSIVLQPMKYWISIYAIGDSPPYSGWGYHLDTIKLAQAVFKSNYLGYPIWTPISSIIGYPADLCYQLNSSGNIGIDVEKYVWDEKNGDWQDCDTENEALDVVICNDINFRIVIQNNGDFPLENIIVDDIMEDELTYIIADPEPDDFEYDPPYYYIGWSFPEQLLPDESIIIDITAHVEGPKCSIDSNYVEAYGEYGQVFNATDEDYCYIHAIEKSRSINRPILDFLHSHPNMFPMLQLVLRKLGLF